MNGWIPTPSARQAAWLLAGSEFAAPYSPPCPISAGEAERLDLVHALASHMHSCDTADMAVCRRLLEHLRGPMANRMPTSFLQ